MSLERKGQTEKRENKREYKEIKITRGLINRDVRQLRPNQKEKDEADWGVLYSFSLLAPPFFPLPTVRSKSRPANRKWRANKKKIDRNTLITSVSSAFSRIPQTYNCRWGKSNWSILPTKNQVYVAWWEGALCNSIRVNQITLVFPIFRRDFLDCAIQQTANDLG